MLGWFQKILKPSTSSPGREQKGNVSSGNSGAASHTSSFCSSSSSSSASGAAPSIHPQCALSSLLRGSRKYDVFVCHSSVEGDSEEAGRLVSFLEGSPRRLRCFLQHRDDCPGGATSTELCQAVQNSHLWALLITSNFLQDEWCQYMMNQALAEGPMSRRIIPLIQNLPRYLYPQELRFFSYIDLSRDPDRGYALLYKTVLTYLKDLVKNGEAPEHNTCGSSTGLSGEDNSPRDTLRPKSELVQTVLTPDGCRRTSEAEDV